MFPRALRAFVWPAPDCHLASAMVFKYVTIRLSKESLNQCQLQMPDLWRILQD